MEKNKENKSWFFDINIIDKSIVRLFKGNKTQITNIGNGKKNYTTDKTDSKRTVRNFINNSMTINLIN